MSNRRKNNTGGQNKKCTLDQVSDLICCICLDDLQVDISSFLRFPCCGKAIHKQCENDVSKSSMPWAQKNQCQHCRATKPRTLEEGIVKYRVWVEKGKAWAQTALANGYEHGYGVKKSLPQAIKYYKLAIKQGEPNAQQQMGVLYDNGKGVAQSDKKAFKLYTLAANQGHTTAQFNLGLSYMNGRGVDASRKMAREWWTKAAEQGLEIAIRYVKLLDKEEGTTTVLNIKPATRVHHSNDSTNNDGTNNSFPTTTAFQQGLETRTSTRLRDEKNVNGDGGFTTPSICCSSCNTPQSERKFKKCSQCLQTRYCSTACQRTHWKEGGHKAQCKILKKTKE